MTAVKSAIEAKLGPRAAEQRLLLSTGEQHPEVEPSDSQTLYECGVDGGSEVVVGHAIDARVQNAGISRKTEIMMRRNKVMDSVM